jgi:hypothetical protein
MKSHLRPKARELIVQTWQSQANLALFLLLLVITVFILPAVNVERIHLRFFGDVVFTFMLGTGVAIAWGQRRLFLIAAAIGAVTLAARWLAWAAPGTQIEIWDEVTSLASVLAIAYVLLAQIFRKGPINVMRVQGAVAVYLLLGVAYAQAYQIAIRFDPTAISSSEGPVTQFRDWIYFSFSTLSTLGYGDIIPTGRFTRSLAIAEAISGQLYLAVLIARLVAMQVSSADAASRRNDG